MINMKPYQPSEKLVVRDSLDDEISDDVEDDVFIRDGRTCKTYEDKGLKRPLMPAKRKSSSSSTAPIMKRRRKCWTCCEPFCYGLACLTIIIALIFLAALLLTLFPIPLQKVKMMFNKGTITTTKILTKINENNLEFVPCSQISVNKVWSKAISRMSSETPVRKSDVNGDTIDDVIIGYGIDESLEYGQAPRCTITKTGEDGICEGGILALNGATGATIWQRWTTFTVFSIYCSVDLNNDQINDCVAAGRGGLIISVNGKDGDVLWELKDVDSIGITDILIDLYTINPIRDLDGDQISDIVAVHVEESTTSKSGHIKIISGSSGKIIRTIPTPFGEEVFVPLQFLIQPDGTEAILIITGGQNTPGGLYSIRTHSLMQFTNENLFETIYRSPLSGFMIPAVLVDITGDSMEDIIISSFNSTVYAFNGQSHQIIWTYEFLSSESVSSIVPGHFDHDNITDFMIKYNTGPGFPIYYYSQTTIISGATGKPLLDSMITDSGGPNSLLGGLSISQSFGGDFFLHWQTHCRGKTEAKDAYQFIPESDIIQQSRADICMLRYNTSTVLKLYAIARHVEPPGAVIFSTDDLILQLNQSDTRQLYKQSSSVSPIKHPKMRIQKMNSKEMIRNDDLQKEFPKNVERKRLESSLEGLREKNLEVDGRKVGSGRNRMISIENNKLDSGRDEKPYIYLPYEDSDKVYKSQYDVNVNPDQNKESPDYDVFYDEQQDRNPPSRMKYVNRGVRSKPAKESGQTVKKVLDESIEEIPKPQPQTLWDLEIEKETKEALSENGNYDFPSKNKKRQNDGNELLNQNLLTAVSSTGALLKPINSELSSVDFVFVLNVRESEIYPPLFLPEDIICIEAKLKAYENYVNVDGPLMEKQFLEQCLKSRIPNLNPIFPKYETQIVITRISITCSCGILKENEICSQLNPIEKQKWTQFMGNYGNGIY